MGTAPTPRRRWFQFRLRTLLILTALLAFPLAWLAYERQKIRERNEWFEALSQDGKVCAGFGEVPSASPWLRTLLGDEWSKYGLKLDLSRTTVSNAELVHLADLPSLLFLNLESSQVTDAGLMHLTGLTNLATLNLESSKVTDAGLVHLTGLANLQQLNLYDTQTTEAGRQKLRQALPHADIYPDP